MSNMVASNHVILPDFILLTQLMSHPRLGNDPAFLQSLSFVPVLVFSFSESHSDAMPRYLFMVSHLSLSFV